MLWAIAMLTIIPFLRGEAMWRTWAALAFASVAAWLSGEVAAYILTDLLAAAVVLRRPRGWAQLQIARLFAIMILFEIGFVLSPQMNPDMVYYAGLSLGWIQWAFLLGWGVYDALGIDSRIHRRSGPLLAHQRDV